MKSGRKEFFSHFKRVCRYSVKGRMIMFLERGMENRKKNW